MTERIEILIIKYFSDNLSEQETQELLSWIETGNNKKKLNDYISINYTIELLKSENNDYSLLWKYIESSLKKPTRKLNYWKYAVAASVLLVVALTIFINKNDQPQFIEPIIVNNNIKVGSDKATLTLESGEEVTLTKGASFQTQNAISNGEEIIYNKTTNKDITYNTLTIPRGGQFQITLADGTQVWLNSESQLKYPVSFTNGENRQVELVYGEAYFDVSPSTEHQGSAFKVSHNAQEVQVLGTEFNIKAYKDETNVYTTLIEGKVSVSTENTSNILKPNEQSNLDIINHTVNVSSVNVYSEISWKDGVFSFKNKTLKKIMRTLSRWYDMDVEFDIKELEEVTFTGVIRKTQNIEDILSAIKSKSINNYQIHDKTIIIE